MTRTVNNAATPSRGVIDPALIAIFAAALISRWAASQIVDGPLLSRAWEYEEVAMNLLSGNGFVAPYFDGTQYRALIHPFYPALCAGVYWFVGQPSLLAMQLVQAAVVIPAGWLAYALGSELAGRKAGLLAALGVTLHPALLLFSLRRHALWFDACIFLMLLWATYRARSSVRLSQSATLGALFGVGLLSRATIGVFMFVACGWLVWQWRRPLRESLPHAAVILGVAFLVTAPWLIRNALVLHRPMGLISTTSYGLWIGNNPAATGGALDRDGRGMDSTALAVAEAAPRRTELDEMDAFWHAAVSYITSNPGRTALNYGRKLRSFLFWSEQTGAWYPAWFRSAYQAFYLLLLGCATLGAYRLVQSGNRAAVVLIACFVLSVGAVQSIFFVEGRHRWEVESGLIVLAACGLARQASRDKTGAGDV